MLSARGSAAAAVPRATPGAGEEGEELPRRCMQRLGRELKQIEAHRAKTLSEHGVELDLSDPSGTDLRAWRLRILSSSFDQQGSLGGQLRALCIDAVELEVWIPNHFPDEPPKVRVLQPSFKPGSFFVHQHGALCLELLTRQGWPSATTLPMLGVQIKNDMSQGKGTVSGPGPMGDPGPAGRSAAWAAARKIESAHSDWNSFSTG
mmetsp:Transcript_36680/g.93466  ORF Transcript_36680/g.93466 Transcript_36680/m.93466 type:complete len:205 (+) Transcript_36680:228-842(+)